MLQTAYWPWPPLCFTCRPVADALPRTVSRNAIFAGLVTTSTPNLRLQPLDHDLEVRFAHAVHHGLVGLLVAGDAERGVLLAQPSEPGRELVLVALGLGGDRVGQQRLGQGSEAPACTGASLVLRVSPVCACWSFATAPMSPALDLGDRLMVLALQGEQLPDALVGALGGVVHGGVGPHRRR